MKVVGLKSGTVTITATVPKSKTVTISAKYVLEIGEGDAVSSDAGADNTSSVNGGGIMNDASDNTDLDLYSSTTDPMLQEYAKQRRNSNAATLLLGIIGWGLVLIAVGYIFFGGILRKPVLIVLFYLVSMVVLLVLARDRKTSKTKRKDAAS